MARKDVSLMLEAAISGDKKLNIIPAIAEQMDKYISEGHGNNDWIYSPGHIIGTFWFDNPAGQY